MRSILVTGAAVLALTTACSGQSDKAAPASKSDDLLTASATPTKKVAAPLVKQYMEALADNSDEALAKAKKLAAPGSLAAGYVQQMIDSVTAYADAGQDPGDASGKLTSGGGQYKLCHDSESDKSCYNYGAFKVDRKGRVATLNVNGTPLRQRILIGGPPAATSLGTVKLLSAFITTTGGSLVLNVQVKSKDKLLTLGDDTTYRTPAGVQRTVSQTIVADSLAPDSSATVQMYFKGPVKLGGTINFKLHETDGNGGYGGDLASDTAVIKLGS